MPYPKQKSIFMSLNQACKEFIRQKTMRFGWNVNKSLGHFAPYI